MNPTQLKEDIRKRWGQRATTYDMSPGHGIHSDREKKAWMDILAAALDKRKGLRILDVGTGTGALALLLSKMGHQVTGIDLSEQMLKLAREKAKQQRLTIDFKIGDAESPPFACGTFDAVVSRHVLWTLPNPDRTASVWEKLLALNGRIVVIDGDWGKDKQTMAKEVWRYMAMPLIAITEKRNPINRMEDLSPHLPMRQRKRPEADIELFEGVGLKTWVNSVKLPRTYSFLNFLKYGYSDHNKYQFVVTGANLATDTI